NNLRSNIWHEGPINCYTCDSEQDCAHGIGVIQKCENNDDQTCVIVFNENGVVRQRGCSDKIVSSQYSTYCSENPARCPTCSSSGCNEATSMDQFSECLTCDSSIDKDCVLNPSAITTSTLCYGGCMTALYPTSDVSNPAYGLVRSCLNDRDIDEQKSCLNGNDPMCVACNEANCNFNALPDVRHSCYRCLGDDCEDPVPEDCPAYRENDQCFMRFEEGNNDAVELGCLSDFDSEDVVINLVKQKSLYICDSVNCNGFEHLPKTFECTSCSSVDTEACATKPTTITVQSKCNTMPYTQCYEKIKGTATERGCLSDLVEDEFYNCLTGSDDKCRICEGNICNEEIIPEKRLRCHRCDSNSDAACHSSPSASSVCPSFMHDDACVASYENGVTKRGCLSEFTCAEDSKNCEICFGNNCNTVNIKKRVDELYGVFQDLPLNCNTCVGDECQTGVRNPRKCEGDPYQDCMTVFNSNGDVVSRGCESVVLQDFQTHCSENPHLCFNCKSNGCNDMTDHLNTQVCLYCDASSNSDCLFNPESITSTRTCTLGCVSSLYPRKTNPKVYDFVRTCFEDIEPDNRESCTKENNCVFCSNDKCNTDILPETGRLSCNHCDGNNCDAPQSRLCTGYAADDQCYMYFDNVTHSVVKMGCRSESTIDILANIKQYFICDGDNCNTYGNLPEARFCYACNSESDVNCASNPSKVTAQNRCQNYPYTECYTRIREDGHTERGCIYNLPIDVFVACNAGDPDSKCRICAESGCNRNTFPASRQQCHRCNSLTDVNCEAEPNAVQACPLFVEDDGCVTQWIGGETRRGCTSELNCDGLNRKNCRECPENGCNSINLANEDIGKLGLFADLPLTCYHCNDTEQCDESPGIFNVCTGNRNQTCTVVFNANGEVIQRGCSDLVDKVCTQAGNVCYDCKSSGCNSANTESDYVNCIFCDAQEDDSCTFNPQVISRTRKCHKGCMTALYPRTDDENPVYELIRTCLDDKNLDDRKNCESSNDPKCKSCLEENCNKDDVGRRKSCYQCRGDECQNAQAQTCRAVMDNDQCFVQFDETGSIVELGCKSKYDPPVVKTLVTAKLLWLCDDDDCNHIDNIPQPQSCTLCNSLTDAKCATNPESIKSYTKCGSLPYSQCYSRVLQNGHTERGCLSNLEDEEFYNCLQNKNATECQSCIGENCNNKIYPSDRTTCHVCSSDTSENCETSPNASQVCLKYIPNDRCVSTIDNNGLTVRGCNSQLSCDESDPSNCQICNGSDCNKGNLLRKSDGKPGLWQDLPLTCFECTNVDDCKSEKSQQTCSGSEYCMTVFNSNGEVVKRGCSDVVEEEHGSYCDVNYENCFNCNSNLCNNANALTEYKECVYCNSETNSECNFRPENVKRRRKCNGDCMTALYKLSNSSAYGVVRSCLDDKDVIDQKLCSSESDDECTSCSGTACNVALIPETRLSCYSCIGDNCVEPDVTLCSKYKPDDQCFILFDEKSDVVQMGCVSDLDESFVSNNIHRLYTCDSINNCNGFENIPKITMCAECNSNEDPDCASSPQNVPTVTQCTSRPNTQCYTKVNNDGSTERGCVSSLDQSQMLSCLGGNDKECSACEGDRCNIQIFPADRRRCQRCNTKDDPTCENSPDASSVCPTYDSTQFCATKLVNGHTYRGCSTEFNCDDSDKQYCRQCYDSDNCNVVDLASINIGEPGKWQGLPLNCYSCEGEECAKGNGIVNVCTGNNLQTCTTVFGLSGSVEKRGCSDAVSISHGDFCDLNPDKCFNCKSNGCNTAQSLEDYTDCYFCDSALDADCSVAFNMAKSRTRKCHGKCMVALYPRTSGNDPAFELARTCLDDMDLDDREACVSGKNEFCKACSGPRCNTMNVPEERFECYKCVDDDCEDMELRQCSAYHTNDQCYTLFNNESSIVGMGCRSEFESDVVTELVKQKQLLLCNEKECNSPHNIPSPKSCSVCSSESNSLCATNPNLVANIERCSSLPYTECYTRVNSYGHTERGCLGSLESSIFYGCIMGTDNLCEICVGDKCNEIDVYPSTRRKCQQCSSTSDPLCGTSPNSNKVCPLYDENESCVTNYRNGVTTRGCSSSMKCDDPENKRTCRICDSDGCNTVNLEKTNENGEPGRWQDIPLTCYTCKGEDDCSMKGDFRSCVNNPFQNCMTVFNTEGKVIQKGCSDVVEADQQSYCEANPEKCMACNSNGCNVATDLNQYVECLACDTDSNSDCVNDVSSITKTRQCYKFCMTALYPLFQETNPSYGLSRSCYDDMDLDDRESCEAGNKEYCQVCENAKCNAVDMPQKRHSCYICEGDSCQDPEIQQCSTYRPDDKCYIRFDEKRSVVALGCSSEFSHEDANYLVKQKRLHICEAEGCNHMDNLPTAQVCTLCNSRTDKDCAVNPSKVTGYTTCSALPFTECYSRVLPDGATERGCLSNLYDEEFLTCLNDTSDTCKKCVGDKCNTKIFPENRLMCHICDSSIDPSCENTPNSLGICPSYDKDDTCVTSFRNNVTYRGCSSNLVCDVTNPRKCVKCSGEGCNTINLSKKQDDNYGMWQDLPLTCLTCSGTECDSSQTTKSLTCDLNNEQDCMTVFDNTGKVVRRGCTDTVENEYRVYCDANEEKCFNCKSNNCNTAVSLTEFTECIYCDSNKDLECIWDPLNPKHKVRQCQGGCMTALYPSDSSYNPSYDLIRTCLNDKELSNQTECSSGNDAKCKSCTGVKCNTHDVPETRFTCYTCDGENCVDPVIQTCPLYKEFDQCYIKFDDTNSVTEMGCVSSFRNQPLENIIKTKKVSICNGVNCNSLDTISTAQRCAVCESGDDASCAVKPFEIASFRTCSNLPYTGCFSKLTESGTTERGCLTDLTDNDFVACILGTDENCKACSGDGCNREIFPANRQQCFTCTSEEESNCESFPTSKYPCRIVSESETCITAISGNITVRGCKSDVYCDAGYSSTCRSCFGSECNSIDLVNKIDDGYHGVWQPLPLRCFTCEGEQCLNSLGSAETCSSRNINQDCMTVFKSNGEVDRRGCSDDVENYKDLYCRQNPDLCVRCKSNECNVAWSLSEYVDCAFCDSSKDPLCTLNPDGSGFNSRKCYKKCMVAMQDQRVIRSCLDDKELRVQNNCNESGSNECASCAENNCNKFVFPQDRLKCHVCTGSSCTSSTGQYCELYAKNDYCFAKYENGKVDLLGCASAQNTSDLAEWEAQNKLYKCEGLDCNELSRLPSEGVCLACDSSKTPNCSQNPTQITTTDTCTAPNNQCVTRINSEGHTIRGCLSSLNEAEQWCVVSGTCAVCSGSKCNNEIFPANRRSCHICNSVSDKDCVSNPNNPLICPIYVQNDSCISKLSADGIVTRGCASQLACENNDNDCQICYSNDCNIGELKGSASTVTQSITLSLLLTLLSFLVNRNL
ncbi:uncharacterized protein LOC133330774, partial [Musca vetustissima]|uniref:uncharacterized protein LOC133330774 n=1 Tax=Musca vetustissima TaxID=27455 RepID=UPI002AB60410